MESVIYLMYTLYVEGMGGSFCKHVDWPACREFLQILIALSFVSVLCETTACGLLAELSTLAGNSRAHSPSLKPQFPLIF